jgi:hypothetical protein
MKYLDKSRQQRGIKGKKKSPRERSLKREGGRRSVDKGMFSTLLFCSFSKNNLTIWVS